MGDMKPYTTKLPENTAEWFDDYIEEEGVSTSAALRQLVEKEKARQELEEDLGDGAARARMGGHNITTGHLTLLVSVATLLGVALLFVV
jgi:hypothetical protein